MLSPGIGQEPLKNQTHLALDIMTNQIDQIIAEKAKNMKAKTDSVITVKGTRNYPDNGGGTYSDKAGGTMPGDFRL